VNVNSQTGPERYKLGERKKEKAKRREFRKGRDDRERREREIKFIILSAAAPGRQKICLKHTNILM